MIEQYQPERSAVASALAVIDPFRSVPATIIAELVATGQVRRFERGARIIRQGEVSGRMYVILAGRVQVERWHPQLTGPVVLAEAGQGEIVGEAGLLDGEPSPSSATISEEAWVIELSAEAVARTLLRQPADTGDLLRQLSQRLTSAAELRAMARRRGWVID